MTAGARVPRTEAAREGAYCPSGKRGDGPAFTF